MKTKPCPDCGKDWGHSYCGTCNGQGFIPDRTPSDETERENETCECCFDSGPNTRCKSIVIKERRTDRKGELFFACEPCIESGVEQMTLNELEVYSDKFRKAQRPPHGVTVNMGDDFLVSRPVDHTAILSAERNPDGLHARYNITKVDGTPVDELARYFVLRLDSFGSDPEHIAACRSALTAYCNYIQFGKRAPHLQKLATDLRVWLVNMETQAPLPTVQR